MFPLSLKRVFSSCNKVFVRNLRGGRLGPVANIGPNPGLDRRIRAFQKDGVAIEDDDAEEFVEKSESDFMTSGAALKDHMDEEIKRNVNIQHFIVKQKYFEKEMPNLLTWSEKEQIRHLNSEYPDEWTPERLAESFPVIVPVVKKLLKYAWKPSSEQRIARHDASAMRNWRELKEGTLDIPEDLREHFLKFSERNIPPLQKKSVKIDITPQDDNIGEFQSIINKCAAYENSEKTNNNTDSNKDPESQQTVAKENKPDKRMTLDELTSKIKQRVNEGSDISTPDQILLNSMNRESALERDSQLNQQIELDDAKKALTTQIKEEIVTVATYPERIRIPKNAYKYGATYKVNDCYYDHDGRFMYRVIGMTE